jgi:protein ImuB
MPLADALSFVPGLAAAEPAKDATALRRLAEWCGRYSPWTAPDGIDGIKIEITGCAHLWGGEGALAADLAARLDRQGITGHIAIADTPGAAWACARFAEAGRGAGRGVVVLPPGEIRAALAPLPVEALRLDPVTAQGLRRVGLKTVGDLSAMPRDAVARRFGNIVAQRLDQARGDLPEPLSPLGETPARRVRLSFAEPIADPADLALAAERLAGDLVSRLALEGTGARRLVLAFHRVDGRVERVTLGTARPSRDPRHIAALFKERLDTVDPGFGVEDMILAAFAVEPLPPEQIDLPRHIAGLDAGPSPSGVQARETMGMGSTGGEGVAALLDRLGNRLGLAALSRLEPRESHIPERASVRISPPLPLLSGGKGLVGGGLNKPPRPIRLFEPPEPVAASWVLPDDPPFRFTWRRRAYRVKQADGPERIAEEWWRPGGSGAAGVGAAGVDVVEAIRDYYRVEDEEGRRFWLFRAGLPGAGQPPRWYVHGVFA